MGSRPELRPTVGVLVLVGLVVLAGVAAAGQPALEVRVQPQRIGVEDHARLTVTLVGGEGQVGLPELGPLENLTVVSGPSTENHFSWINGVATSSVRFSYLLQPGSVGPATVGGLSVKVGDVVLRSEPTAVEVVAGSLSPPKRTRQVPPGRDPFADLFDPGADLTGRREPVEASLSLRQIVGDRELTVGEVTVATVVLDTTLTGIEGFEWVTAPTYPGWWAQRVDLPEQISPELVERDGARYHRYVVARHVLVPLREGTLAIPTARARIGIRARSVFAPLQVAERESEAQEVVVAARPTPPDGYAGAVGDLRYTASLEPRSVTAGESAVLSIELSGKGNLPLVEAPPLWPSCAGCETYPPEEESEVTVDGAGIRGRRVWRTTLVPRESGELRLEPVSLAVFDPSAKRYRSQSLGPLALAVVAPPPTPEPTQRPGLPAAVGAAEEPASDGALALPSWLPVAGGMLGGVLLGALATWALARRRPRGLPRRRTGQSPADRARELQAILETWWLGVRDGGAAEELAPALEQLRRELDTVRFAPGRADHSHTIDDLEERVRSLLRRT